MAHTTERIFKIGDGVEGGLSDDGKRLPVYSIGDTTYQSSNITQMGENIIYKISEDTSA